MSYQVLARKYRPANFQELEGQDHVLGALVNALDHNRLHHAYLFTGTRGVGKTTIARILAKCLNCDQGVTSTPCGECVSCTEIAQGRSVDLIEVDAASRTGVDDMRDLLDNVQYMPSASRFKIYLIDEVHMLSKSSFNAMLKTLEEPPEHVKFLFATTDPKKLPITVLSRCLQFNLKNLSPQQIVRYLGEVLTAEQIEFEEAALWQLGRAADGSMRDALSLTDQAISYGDNAVDETSVKSMLGSIDQQDVYGLLDALLAKDAERILTLVADLSMFAPDFSGLLDDLLGVLHRVTIAQLASDAIDNSQGDQDLVLAVAGMTTPEDVQLLYQIGINGQKDLPYAPDPRRGFEMTLLRMLAFTPLSLTSDAGGGGPDSGRPKPDKVSPVQAILTSLRAEPSGKPAHSADHSAHHSGHHSVHRVPDSVQAEPAGRPQPSSGASTSAPKPSMPASVRAAVSLQKPPAATAPVRNDRSSPESADPGSPAGSRQGDASLAATRPTATITRTEAGAESSTQPRVSESVITEHGATKPGATESRATEHGADESGATEPRATEPRAAEPRATEPRAAEPVSVVDITVTPWPELLDLMSLTGVTGTLAANCASSDCGQDFLNLKLNEAHASLWNETHERRIAEALSRVAGREVRLSIEIGDVEDETPAELRQRERAELQARAVAVIENDTVIQTLIRNFNGRLDQASIKPVFAGSTGSAGDHR
ncbi:MAG: DNA polymerase III subunit gamma/tau [Proteobacteria bacterium]|jgi:DNA polymerase-3 subunit gamma/tau|nr:DNA polymerase III subunit gamma/tau [Pseudomonadota bacterium]MDA1299186.1 DNA polymerase III subunit gamma/tau [Pseudomonadota bacterium]